MSDDALKACPWCGGKAAIVTTREENYGYWTQELGARCQSCGAAPPQPNSFPVSEYDWDKRRHLDTRIKATHNAAASWNNRAAQKEQADETE